MIKTLAGSLRDNKKPALLTLLFITGEVFFEVLIPFFTADMVNMIKAGAPLGEVAVLGGKLVVMAVLSLCCGAVAARTGSRASTGFARNLRRDLFTRVQDFSFENIDKFSSASLVTRMTTDITNVQMAFMMVIRIAVRSPLMFLFAITMAFIMGGRLALTFVIVVPVLVFGLLTIAKHAMPAFRSVFQRYDKLNESIEENVRAMRVVKGFAREEYEKKRFNASAEDLKRAHMRAERLFALTNPLQLGVMWTCSIILLLLGGDKVLGGRLNTGELVSMLTYTNQVIGALAMCAAIIVIVTMTRESVVRITEVLSEVPDIAEVESELKVESGEIEFRDVCFSYTGSEDNLTLRNIDLHIRSGETIGIIGGTGEGKSTLVQLIPRFYDVLSGELLIGGRDIKEYSLYELRESVSMVLQKNMLFSGTIKDNLRWGDPNASDEDIERACRLACAHDFVSGFPDGYDTELGQGGVNVSGGQKQRLCIARALLKKPKILILDDSTSAVDSRTEESIRNAFREFIPTTTKLIIAQRISSIMDADRIIVMDKGCISDVGTHDELMERSEIYHEVYTSQHKEVKEDE